MEEDEKNFIFTGDGRKIDFNDKKKKVTIRLSPFLLEDEACENISKYIENNDEIESLRIIIGDFDASKDDLAELYINKLISKNGKLLVDPEKITVQMSYIDDHNLSIFRHARNLVMSGRNIKYMQEIRKKFPNLKNIELQDMHFFSTDYIGNNFSNLFEAAQYTDIINFGNKLDLKTNIEEYGLDNKFIGTNSGNQLINIERFGTKKFDGTIDLSIEDIKKLGIDKIKNTGCKISIVAQDAGKFLIEDAQKIENQGIEIESVKIITPENESYQNTPYEVDEFVQIKEKLEQMVEGIDPNMSELQKFKEVYKRVCSNIIYDYKAAYPKTEEEERYSDEQTNSCRNLKNGLLEGKCVCAGYADILRNALAMVGIEAKYISGFCVDEEKTIEEFERNSKIKDNQTTEEKDGKVYIGEWHAWCKVKIDGEWYNTDPTWDVPHIKHEEAPTHCLKSDDEIKRTDKKIFFDGPECNKSMDIRDIRKLFDDKHIYIGRLSIPRFKDIQQAMNELGTQVVDGTNRIRSTIRNFFQTTFSKKENLMLDSPKVESGFEEKKEESPSWDLNNWDISRDEFIEGTKKIIGDFQETTEDPIKDTENPIKGGNMDGPDR